MDTFANSSISTFTSFYLCASSAEGSATFTAWLVLYLLLFPLFLFVLLIGVTKWHKQRNTPSVSMNHTDVFTFHMMVIEILVTLAGLMLIYGVWTRKDQIAFIGAVMITVTGSGQMYFHCLTCGERYLAVVHPITYLHLKKRGGVTIRNISIGVAWLLSFSYMAVLHFIPHYLSQIIISLLIVVTAIVPTTFCSIAALCVLIRPGPGNRKRLDQSKWSAFTTITAILGVLLMRMVILLLTSSWSILFGLEPCVFSIITFWLSLPSSLVLPLLFLHRAGKLPNCS